MTYTLYSCRTISFGCLVSTGCFTRWWILTPSYSALQTESSTVTGGMLKTSDDSGRLGTYLSIAGLRGVCQSLSFLFHSLPPSPLSSLSLLKVCLCLTWEYCLVLSNNIVCVIFSHCRHIYNPLIKSGYNKIAAQLIVFAMSAFFHEVLICIILL